ncbi:hypothetical protein YC2023_014743 [Brassica napus]
MNLKAHYKSRRNRYWATLSKVYFPDLLTGTATCAAVFLLFLTLIGTVASVIQAYKSFENNTKKQEKTRAKKKNSGRPPSQHKEEEIEIRIYVLDSDLSMDPWQMRMLPWVRAGPYSATEQEVEICSVLFS